MTQRKSLWVIAMVVAWLGSPSAGRQSVSSQPPSAEALLAAAVTKAQAENTNIFVDFGASWCVPCLRLHAFLDAPGTKAVMDRHFVRVSLTVLEVGTKAALNTPGAEELLLKWSQIRGLPFWVFLGPDRAPLGNSHELGEEADRFHEALAKVAPRMTEADRNILAAGLSRSPEGRRGVVANRLVWKSMASALYRTSISPDGRHVAHFQGSKIVVHDLVSKSDRTVSRPVDPVATPSWGAITPLFSRDGRWVAYSWQAFPNPRPPNPHQELHVVALEQDDSSPPKVLLNDPDVAWVVPTAWSPDGGTIAVAFGAPSGATHVALVSTTDGSRRALASFEAARSGREPWRRGQYTMAFSPDGRYLAFDVREHTGHGRDVFAFEADTGRPLPVAVRPGDDAFMGWSPDGTTVLFTSDRTGAIGLWAAPFRKGTAAPAVLIKEHTGELVPLGTSSDGALFYQAYADMGETTIHRVPFDFETGRVMGPAITMPSVFVGGVGRPAWSEDGREIAFIVEPARFGEGQKVGILSVDTGRVRLLDPDSWLDIDRVPINWLPGHRAVLVEGESADGQWGTWKVDVGTGVTSFVTNGSLIPSPKGTLYFGLADRVVVRHDLRSGRETEVLRGPGIRDGSQSVSPDGRTIYYLRLAPDGANANDAIVARDLASGRDRVVFEERGLRLLGTVSPDGRFLAAIGRDADGKRFDILLPTTGAAPHRVRYLGQSINNDHITWAQGGRSYFTTVRTPAGTNQQWLIPTDGTAPKPVSLPPFLPSPAGSAVAFRQSTPRTPSVEIWTMEFGAAGGVVR